MASSHHGQASESESELKNVDWEAVEQTEEFQELVKARRKFVIPATIFFLAWYLGFVALAGYAQDFMAESVYEGLTVGYVLALTQFVMVAVLGLMYLRRAQRTFDPLADKVAEMVAGRGNRFTKAGTGAGARDGALAAATTTTTPAAEA
jgi:uncharacterized membrane protein (DUF485 family)